MIFKLFGGPMDGAVYCLSREQDQRSTNRKPDGLWFNGKDDCGRDAQHQYKDAGLIDLPGQYGMAIKFDYDGHVVDVTTPGFCEHGIVEGEWCESCNKVYKDAAADPDNDIGIAKEIECANCGEMSTNPGQFIPDGRWLCCEACRKELSQKQSLDDLAASGGIVDAP